MAGVEYSTPLYPANVLRLVFPILLYQRVPYSPTPSFCCCWWWWLHVSGLQGCTALVIAAQYGFVELVIYLSNHGCDPASVDSVGDSALHWAAYKGTTSNLVRLAVTTMAATSMSFSGGYSALE